MIAKQNIISNKERNVFFGIGITSLAVLFCALLNESWIAFTKPVVILCLAFYYIKVVEKVNILVLISLVFIMIPEIMTAIDFEGYFKEINVLLIVYYTCNIILLRYSLSKIKFSIKKVFTLQLVITMLLISYIIFASVELILPAIKSHLVLLSIQILLFIVFIGLCYYIYLNSRTVISSSLMIAASSFLIVNIMVAFNKLYLYLEIFVLISHLVQIFGQFFLIKFFTEQKKLSPMGNEFV